MVKEVKEPKLADPKKEVKVEVLKPVTASNTMNVPSAQANENDDLFVIASDLTSAVIPPPKQKEGKATK